MISKSADSHMDTPVYVKIIVQVFLTVSIALFYIYFLSGMKWADMVLTKMNIECSKFVKSNNPTKTTGSGHTILIHLKLIAFLLKLNSPSGKKTKPAPTDVCNWPILPNSSFESHDRFEIRGENSNEKLKTFW